ncbi:MFS transporter [Chitinophaga japonensis]|uniref:Putative MFS family arabinose efflux permease n=1 Tax=Chitinophaga japonensis TaxID=104662 RepID=A0A562SZG5_CHIJA|nr:MFS transporter [Chitinophaga japonensis]TWI86661.1 putative MFS family arabinose efflux permease [Chitinophaga japonensis]
MTKYIAAFGIFGIITTEFGVIGILPQLARYYHISIEAAGMLISIFALIIALCGPWVTLLLSGFDRKKLMLLTLAVFILSNALSAVAGAFPLQLLARALPAFLHPVYFATAIGVAVSTAAKGEEHRAVAVIFGGVSLATVIGVPFATWMASLYGWQASFIVAGIVNVLALLSVWTGVPPMPVTEKVSYGQQLRILTRPSFLLAALSVVLLLAAMFAMYSYFADYMEKVYGLSGAEVSTMLMLFGVAGVAGNWLAGRLLGKSVWRTLQGCLLALALVYILLYLSGSYSAYTIALIAVWGLVHTACFVVSQTWIREAAPGAEDFANSLGVSFGNLGLTIGTTLSGWVIAQAGIAQTPWASMALVLAALLVGCRK